VQYAVGVRSPGVRPRHYELDMRSAPSGTFGWPLQR
jgi:hypothetical protein